MIARLKEWWNRPSAQQRVIDAMVYGYWQAGVDIMAGAKVGMWRFLLITRRLIKDDVIEWQRDDQSPVPPNSQGPKELLYRLKTKTLIWEDAP